MLDDTGAAADDPSPSSPDDGGGPSRSAEPDARRDLADSAGDDGLLSRLRLIEERPLAERADAYARIHAELVEALEGDDAVTRSGLDD
jgi:hypothetical protein